MIRLELPQPACLVLSKPSSKDSFDTPVMGPFLAKEREQIVPHGLYFSGEAAPLVCSLLLRLSEVLSWRPPAGAGSGMGDNGDGGCSGMRSSLSSD